MTNRRHASSAHRHAAIMLALRSFSEVVLALRSFSEVGPVLRSFCEGGFTDLVGYTTLMKKGESMELATPHAIPGSN